MAANSANTRPSLLLRIRDADDRAAWGEFVDIYAPLIHGYAMNRGVQDADAADLTQEVLQTVSAKAKQFDYDPSRGAFRGWLFTVTLNKLRDQVARRQRQERGTGKTEVQGLLEQRTDEAADERLWNQHHQWRLFLWAAEKVRVDFRENTWQAFWSTSVESQPVKDVATRLGISVGAVHIAKSRVIAKLRQVLETVEAC